MCSPSEIFINVYSEKPLFFNVCGADISCKVRVLELSTFFLVPIVNHAVLS